MSVNLVKVIGHANHVGTDTLVIEGQSQGVREPEINRLHEIDAKAIFNFLRDNLPSGTFDRVAVRLGRHAIDFLINRGAIQEFPEANEVREALRDAVAELDSK